MSTKSDEAPIRFARTDHDNAATIAASFIVKSEQYRCGVEIKDSDPPSEIARKLRRLADTIEQIAQQS
jgi:hypothetical protein